MSDERHRSARPGGSPAANEPGVEPLHDETGITTATERELASRELRELAEHWSEREQSYDTRSAGDALVEHRGLWSDALRRFMANRAAMVAIAALTLMVLLSIVAPMVSPHDPNLVDYDKVRQSPSAQHPFGTDNLGRDLWTRAWLGGRISLAIAFAVSLTILVIGVLYGSISGYLGGRVDTVMMRVLDALYGLPYLPFAILAVLIVRERFPDASPLTYMVPALAITTWFTAARIVRSQVLSLKENDYVEAAESQGARWDRVVFRHIVPNSLGIFVVAIFLEVPAAILGEATLSFLGLGVQPPDASWGKMANEGYRAFRSDPHLIAVPGTLIAVTVLSAIAVADGLRDALDPRGKAN